MRGQKGITLVALIITIVVLLILAVVAIVAIDETDIIPHANNAANTYNAAVTNEQTTLNGYVNTLQNYSTNYTTTTNN